ncbi:MAG: HNH endonuclease [Lachnospiraceae bacterium]|nr:HNH endonuclease [Lachnospiraceae bacterium]
MISEVTVASAKTLEVSGKVAETTKKVGDAIDITRRIDITARVTDVKSGIDISKRIVPDKAKLMDYTGKELTEKQKTELTAKGMSKGILGDCTYKDGIVKLKTVYNKFENRVLPETDVKYVRKTVDIKGTKVEGVFPEFKSVFTTHLPDNILMSSDKVQFNHCVKNLQNEIKNNPGLSNHFSSRQLDQIKTGKTPGGYTWHHNEQLGKMELVKTDIHDMAKHTGGRAIWGGGGIHR